MAPPQVRTVTLNNAPSGAGMLTLTCGPTNTWNPGSWVEYMSSAPSGLQIAGFTFELNIGTLAATARFQIDFGVGASGSEVVVCSFYGEIGNPSNQGPQHELFPLPIDLITAGSRVTLRLVSNTPSGTLPVGLLYYLNLDSTVKSTTALQHYPVPVVGDSTAANGRVAITPNAVAWANSSWVLLSPSGGWSQDVKLAHLNLAGLQASVDWEFDIAFTSSHTLKTTEAGWAAAAFGSLYLSRAVFAAEQPTVPANTEVYGQFRKSDTNTTTIYASLNFYNTGVISVPNPGGGGTPTYNPPLVNPSAGLSLCGGAVPLAWMELQLADGTTIYRYSKVPINIDSNPKTGRVLTFGSVTRQVGTDQTAFAGASISPVLLDTDRALRTLEQTDSLVGARVSIFMATEAALRASQTPRRIFDGVVVDTQPTSGLEFTLQIEDYFGATFQSYVNTKTFPQRVFNTKDFPNLGNGTDLSNPGNPGVIGKPVPIGYGLLSDESLGTSAVGIAPATFVGRRFVGGFNWDEYVVFGHAAAPGGVLSIFGNIGGTRQKFTSDMYGVDVIAPGHEPSWTSVTGNALPYRDYNGNRYTVFYARGPRSDSAIQGSIPFSVNIGGVETVGDGTGTMITGLFTQLVHLFNNWVFGNYASGAWLNPPVVPTDLYTRINVDSFTTAQTTSANYLAGGFQGAFMLGTDGNTLTLTDVFTQAALCGFCQFGVNRDGQLIVTMINTAATLNRHIIDVTDTMARTFQSRRRRDQLANWITYRYGKRYAKSYGNSTPASGSPLPGSTTVTSSGQWTADNQVVSDTVSILKYGTRKLDASFTLLSDPATANMVANLRLKLLKDGPIMITFQEGLCGLDSDLGQRDTLDHFEFAPSVATNHSLWCEVHTINIDALTVDKTYRDIASLVLP